MSNEPYVAWVPRYFNVALSGGGHRASLFTLGALLYITDGKANDRVKAISSVSGGSITNGFVAQECNFVDVEPDDFEKIAAGLGRKIVHRGLLMATWLSRLYLYTLLAGASLTLSSALFYWPIPVSRLIALIAFVFWSGIFLMRGNVIERLLRKVLFYNKSERRGTILDDLRRGCDHIFCTTDLVLGRPFYFVARKSGPFAGYSRLDRDDLKEALGQSPQLRLSPPPFERLQHFPGGFLQS